MKNKETKNNYSDWWVKKLIVTVDTAKENTQSSDYSVVVTEMKRLSTSQVNRVQESSTRYRILNDKVKRMNNGKEKSALRSELAEYFTDMNNEPFIDKVSISYPDVFIKAYGLSSAI